MPRTLKTKPAPRVDVNLTLSLADKELRALRKRLRQKHLMELVTHADRALEHVRAGRAYREILRAADTRPPDLIVMGAQGRGGVELALFGSTTQQIVRGATCPVLTVRSKDHRFELP